MAIAVTKDFPCSKRIGRNLRSLSGSIAFGSSYPTGGELATAITRYFRSCSQIICEQGGGFLFVFDKVNKKIKVLHPTKAITPAGTNADESAHTHTENTAASYTQNATTGAGSAHGHAFTGTAVAAQAGTEVPNAADLSELTSVKFMAMGR